MKKPNINELLKLRDKAYKIDDIPFDKIEGKNYKAGSKIHIHWKGDSAFVPDYIDIGYLFALDFNHQDEGDLFVHINETMWEDDFDEVWSHFHWLLSLENVKKIIIL